MSDDLTVVDQLEGDPHVEFELRPIGDTWQTEAHVLIVLAGDGGGPEYAVTHPTGCDDNCPVWFQLCEGGFEQPTGYPQVPTEVGMYLCRAEFVKGGWINGSHPVDHDCYLIFDTLGGHRG